MKEVLQKKTLFVVIPLLIALLSVFVLSGPASSPDLHGSTLAALEEKQTTVLEFEKPARNAEHPTMKPVPLMAYEIRNSSRVGDTVLDSFGGSGSTLMACEQTGRKCVTMELDPHYCDVILKRWEDYTGQKAERVNE